MTDAATDDEPREDTKTERAVVYVVAAIVILMFLAPVGIPLWNRLNPSDIERAEQRLQFLEANGGDKEEICVAKKAIEDAYAEAKDGEGYRRAKLTADICYSGLRLDQLQNRSIY